MKNISIQYQELKEGKMTQHQFLRNARMMFPSFVTNHNSFDDSVKILKTKGLLNEGNAVKGTPDKAPTYDYPTQPGKYMKVVQEPEVDEQDGIYPATTVTDIPKEEVSKPIKSKTRPDGLEPIKNKDTKNEMKKIRIVKESKKNLTEANINVKQIQDKYNEMFGKNPQTTFADVAKALGVSEQEIAFALFAPDLAKNMGNITEADDISPDAKAFVDMIEKNPTLKSRLEKISNPKEIEDIVSKLFAKIDPEVLKNMPGIKSAVTRGISKIAGTSSKEEFRPGVDLGKSSEKFLSQFRSPGASGPGQSFNKLKETIKELVRKMVNEYEVGDESDETPSIMAAIDRVVEEMKKSIESNDLGLKWTENDLINVFTDFQDRIGYRYSDEAFDRIIDGAIDKLRKHGYNLNK
jgi:hypothetical protein